MRALRKRTKSLGYRSPKIALAVVDNYLSGLEKQGLTFVAVDARSTKERIGTGPQEKVTVTFTVELE